MQCQDRRLFPEVPLGPRAPLCFPESHPTPHEGETGYIERKHLRGYRQRAMRRSNPAVLVWSNGRKLCSKGGLRRWADYPVSRQDRGPSGAHQGRLWYIAVPARTLKLSRGSPAPEKRAGGGLYGAATKSRWLQHTGAAICQANGHGNSLDPSQVGGGRQARDVNGEYGNKR
jgi:hypothetical protein